MNQTATENAIAAMCRHRQFIVRRALSEVRHRYAGSGLGVFWNLLQPLLLIIVYALVFSRLMHMKVSTMTGPFSYTIYLCSGFLPWVAFSDAVVRGTNAFIANAGYLKKLNIPEPVFVAESTLSCSISLSMSFSLLLIFACVLGHTPTWHWLLLPIPLLALMALGFGVGLLLATLNVFFRDIGHVLGILLQVVMWSVPIVYVRDLPSPAIQAMFAWHPIVPAITATRDLFLHSALPDASVWIGLFAWPVVLSTIAFAVLRGLKNEIRDVI